VWEHFIRKRSDGLALTSNSKCNRAICKYCKKDIVALVARMKQHLNKCQLRTGKDDTVNLNESENSENMHTTTVASELDQSEEVPGRSTIKRCNLNIDFLVCKTSKKDKEKFDIQVAKFLFATNTAFNTVNHHEFKKLVELLHPGY